MVYIKLVTIMYSLAFQLMLPFKLIELIGSHLLFGIVSPVHIVRKFIYLLIAIMLATSLNTYAADVISPDKKVVKVYKVTTAEVCDLYKYPVIVEPKYARDMYPEVTGYVQNIYVTVGSWVKKDSNLMQLKPTELGTEAFIIKSPMEGQVTQITKKIGSHVKPDDLLLQIVDPNELTIKIEIPQAELGILQVSQQGEAQFHTIPVQLPVVIMGVSSYVDPATGTATGQLDWDKKNLQSDLRQEIKLHLYPGMLGYVTFKVNKRQGMTIPVQAVLREKNATKVRLVKDGKATRVIVKLGKRLAGGLQEVIDGLQPGDDVVVSTNKYIRENEEVVVQ